MVKKYLIITLILLLTLFSSSVFAFNEIGDAARDMGNEMKDSWDKMGNTAENMGNHIQGAADSVGETVGNFMGLNDDNDYNNDVNNNINSATANNNDNYQATRTSVNTNENTGLLGMNNTMWTWIILAVLGIAIVGLVWYYGSQTTEHNNK